MGEYEVGYRKPPESGQFKPGQSGNRRGRPKRPPPFAEQLRRELHRKVTIVENGVKKKITLLDATLRQLATKAAKGDIKATQMLLSLRETFEAPPSVATDTLHENDSAVLANFYQSLHEPDEENR